jgi:hypothetical protein
LGAIQQRGGISEEDFILVRWDADLLKTVQDVSVSVGEDFSEEDVFDIVEGIKRKHFLDSEKALAELQRDRDEELSRVIDEAQAQVNAMRLEKDDLAKRHATLESKIKKFAGFIAWSVSICACSAFVILLIVSALQSMPAGIIPEQLKLIALSPFQIGFILLINAGWCVSSLVFGVNVRSISRSLDEWISTKILGFFTK